MILLIDNYDSFTYNLVQRLGEIDPSLDLEVHRNDQITLDEIAGQAADASDHFARAVHAERSGHLLRVRRRGCRARCRSWACAWGISRSARRPAATIVRAKRLMHGKTDMIHHDGQGLFAGLENPFRPRAITAW